MITVVIEPSETGWDPIKEEFIYSKQYVLNLEHSLISISKWESKWHKPFLKKDNKTPEELIDYIKCMTTNKGIPDEAYNRLSKNNLLVIKDYIDDPMTATTVSEPRRKKGGRYGNSGGLITSELIYYWMISYGIPVEFERWHINRLLMLIRVCEAKNQDEEQMSNQEIYKQNRELNMARRKQFNSKG